MNKFPNELIWIIINEFENKYKFAPCVCKRWRRLVKTYVKPNYKIEWQNLKFAIPNIYANESLKTVKWYYYLSKLVCKRIGISIDISFLRKLLCYDHSNLDVLKFLSGRVDLFARHTRSYEDLERCITFNRYDIFKWLILKSKYQYYKAIHLRNLCRVASKKNDIKYLNLIVSHLRFFKDQSFLEDIFINLLQKTTNLLKVIKWYFSKFKSNKPHNNYNILNILCKYNNLQALHYVLRTYGIEKDNIEQIIIQCIKNQNIKILKYLCIQYIQITNIKSHPFFELKDIFKSLAIFKFIANQLNFTFEDLYENDYEMLRLYCKDLDIWKWVIGKYNFNAVDIMQCRVMIHNLQNIDFVIWINTRFNLKLDYYKQEKLLQNYHPSQFNNRIHKR